MAACEVQSESPVHISIDTTFSFTFHLGSNHVRLEGHPRTQDGHTVRGGFNSPHNAGDFDRGSLSAAPSWVECWDESNRARTECSCAKQRKRRLRIMFDS